MRSSGFSLTGTLIRFTGERRVAKLSKPEERQRSPRMTPLEAAIPGPRQNLWPGLGYPSAVALERVTVYLDADAGVLASPTSLVSPANRERKRAAEPTRTADPISLRVRGQWLLSVARACKSRIDKRFIVPSFARYCRVLRPG
jgi:hypothetical protein